MTVRAGDLWVADIAFTNGAASKRRPILVLWIEGADAVVAAVTSAAPRSQSDVLLQEWAAAGLRVPSTVRLARLDCLEQSLLRHPLGTLSNADAIQVREVWDRCIKPQF